MIVKKMPILQGFPDFETVKFFTGKLFKKYNFSPIFYDIETTGLSRNSTFLYLIGAAALEEETWYLYQWMAESSKEELTILRIFSQFLSEFDYTISYNGNSFDQAYLEAKYEQYQMPSPFKGKISLDLYQTLRPLKKLLKLSSMKQPCMEEFLGIRDRIYTDGKECIRLYNDFLKKRDASIADVVIGHNLEDILGLGKIYMMLGYLCLFEGDYEVACADLDDESLILKLQLPCSLPAAFSNGSSNFYLTGQEDQVSLIIKTQQGRLRQYYPNPKDYYYLTEEDCVIPRSLGSSIDRRYRKAATKDTCYTWFCCDGSFLSSPAKQKQYLTRTLPYLLGTLK